MKEPDPSNKKVTIIVVQSSDEYRDDDYVDYDDDSDPDEITCCTPKNTPKKHLKVEKVKEKVPISKKFKIVKGTPITNLKSLIKSLEHPKSTKFQKDFVSTLCELDGMIGMNKFKEQIINQILFFIQDYQEPGIFLHTVLYGPPGSGKTSCCGILSKIYSKIGILPSDKIVVADRSSLIGKYLGHTSIKTKTVLESAKGGVLLLDEVYSLGNKEGGDSFSKECIDTINQYLSEHVDEFICVVAGYKEQVDECFFNYNPGLERRFPWKFNIDNYTSGELCKIMISQLDNDWIFKDIEEEFIIEKFKNNKDCFPGNGGDTKNLLDKCKMAHSRRMFSEVGTVVSKRRKKGTISTPTSSPVLNNSTNKKKELTKDDFETGLKYFIESKNKKQESNSYINSMYI
jgi:SpoVK/Ycf46/Vps4 family AAA+-type ATPase